MRDQTWDIVKGIGILLVIINHIMGFPIISMFHMPLFFIASGYFAKPNREKSFYWKNFKSLIIPYLKWGFLITLIYFLLDKGKGLLYLKDVLLGISFDNNYGISFGPLWFLLSLFWCKCIYNILSKHINNDYILAISILLSLGVIVLSQYCNIKLIPYFITTSFPALFFYSMGVFWKTHIDVTKFKSNHIIWLIIAIISISWYQLKSPGLNYSLSKLTFFPFCLINGFLYTLLIYWAVSKIQAADKKIKWGGQFLAFCGQNSMDMFLFHSVEFAFIIGGLRNSLEVVIHSSIIIALINIIINTAFAILYVYTKRILFSAIKKSTKA